MEKKTHSKLCIHQEKNKFKFNYQKNKFNHHALHSPKNQRFAFTTKRRRNATKRHETTRHDTGRHDTTRHDTGRKDEEEKTKEERKTSANPDPRTREAASLANAVALPVAVHKTPSPIRFICILYSLSASPMLLMD